ncbi:hypothetical protein NC653_028635 [Populus alba x Populus x berolinensis]|uniref:Uncharacterized protein n=2 Tax=Populus TaxID=3689 RepID=A0A4U5M0Z2_POPAL|nr:hypothetical protein NC653_028635 [Populus alba x Populus x berolinensis]TKR61943.1 hypothetical protein D5086_0000323950 [Populus alba]
MDKEVSHNSMDSTIANVNGRLEKLATYTEPTVVYSSEREVAATHHLGKVLGIHRDTNDGMVAEYIQRQIDMKYIEGMVGLTLGSCSGAQERSSPVTGPVFMSQVTPSHEQQSVLSIHDSVFGKGYWQYSNEASINGEGLFELMERKRLVMMSTQMRRRGGGGRVI